MFHVFSTFCPHFAPCSTFCPHFVSIFSTFWKLREVYMLKNTPHDSLFSIEILARAVVYRMNNVEDMQEMLYTRCTGLD